MSGELDISELQRAVRFVIKNSKKDEAEVVNKTALKIVIGAKGVKGAIQLTPRASASAIKAAAEKARGIVAKRLRAKGRLGNKNKNRNVSKKQFERMVKFEVARRLRSRGYTAGPGWHKAAVSLGGKGVKRQAGFAKSEAAKGRGKKATVSSLVATIENAAPAAAKIGGPALQQAVDNAVKDMVEYWEEKTQSTFDRA